MQSQFEGEDAGLSDSAAEGGNVSRSEFEEDY